MNHLSQPEDFSRLLDEAAEHIARQSIHPGQTVPGMWNLDGDSNEPARLIGVIVTLAIAHVCKEGDCDLQEALQSYAEISKTIPWSPVAGLTSSPPRISATPPRRCAW